MCIRRVLPPALTFLALLVPVVDARAAPTLAEFPVGAEPYAVSPGPDGDVSFTVVKNPGAVGRITPAGAVTRYTAGLTRDGRPRGITSGPGGTWFTLNNKDKIGRITSNGAITEFSTGAADKPSGITSGPDGNLWFTAYEKGKIARITPTGEVTAFAGGSEDDGQPEAITTGADNNLWFTSPGNKLIGRMTPQGVLREFGAGVLVGTPWKIAKGPDGNVWFTQFDSAAIGRITPAGVITQFRTGLPGGSAPNSITTGADGNLYFTDSGTNVVGRVTPAGAISTYATGLSAGAGLRGITSGADGRLWFAEENTSQIGRLTVAPTAGATTTRAVGSVGATLASTVTPNSEATTYQFEWGETTAYGQTTPQMSAGAGATPQAVSSQLSPLSPETTYHARLVATNATGTSRGPDRLFRTTAAGAPQATSLPATGVAATQATFNATVNPENVATSYRFEWGPSDAPRANRAPETDASVGSDATDRDVSAAIDDLLPNTSYVYRVVATSANGTTEGDPVEFTTDAVAPGATTGEATFVTATTAELSAAVDPRGSTTAYRFEWGTTDAYGAETAGPGTALSEGHTERTVTSTLTGLAPATTYHYRVVAVSNAGETPGLDRTFTTADVTAAAGIPTPQPPAAAGAPTAVPTQPPGAPVPVFGRSAVAAPTRGIVLVRVPGSARAVALDGASTIPVGSTIDTRAGAIALRTALNASGRTQSATLHGARFRVELPKRLAGTVDLVLIDAATGCPRASSARLRGVTARAAASRAKAPIRLWGSDRKGKYRTHGRNSVATVRGTRWVTTETCAGTRTTVLAGAVSVFDRGTGRARLIRAGDVYLARARR